MNPRRHLEQATQTINRIGTILDGVVANIADQADGLRANQPGTGSRPTGTHADPTAVEATRANAARSAMRQLEHQAAGLSLAAHRLAELVDDWVVVAPREPTDYERRAADGDPLDNYCDSCARITSPAGDVWRSYADRNIRLADGSVKRACDFCRKWFADFDGLPPVDVLTDRRDGKTIYQRADRAG